MNDQNLMEEFLEGQGFELIDLVSDETDNLKRLTGDDRFFSAGIMGSEMGEINYPAARLIWQSLKHREEIARQEGVIYALENCASFLGKCDQIEEEREKLKQLKGEK